MATDNKDFKVKNGLAVTNGGTFGGAVTVGTPTIASHAATKEYVDSLTGSMAVSSTAPSSICLSSLATLSFHVSLPGTLVDYNFFSVDFF